jgi:hypothetical protein
MDQTNIGLQSVVKALIDTIAPAIDPSDHLAKEQLRLAASYVDFIRQRLHLIHARERYDLRHYVALANEILAAGMPGDATSMVTLRSTLATAVPIVSDPAALTDEIRSTALELAHAVAAAVQEAHRAHPNCSQRVDMAVLAATEDKLELERLWYQPVGFDPSPRRGRSLEECLK